MSSEWHHDILSVSDLVHNGGHHKILLLRKDIKTFYCFLQIESIFGHFFHLSILSVILFF